MSEPQQVPECSICHGGPAKYQQSWRTVSLYYCSICGEAARQGPGIPPLDAITLEDNYVWENESTDDN